MLKIVTINAKNFQNFKDMTFDFEKETVLYGMSGCGKSTVKNAWYWLCGIDTDSPYPKKDKTNIQIDETEVYAKIYIDGLPYELKRIAKHTFKDGIYNGSKADNYFIDNVPMQNATNYKNKLSQMFGLNSFADLKVLTQMDFFNSENGTTWDWRKRKDIIYNIFKINDCIKEIALQDKYESIKIDLQKFSTTELLKRVSIQKKEIIKEKDKTNTLLESKLQEIKNYSFDYASLKAKKLSLNEKLMQEQEKIDNLSSKKREIELDNEIKETNFKIYSLKNDDKIELLKLNSQLDNITTIVETKSNEIKNNQKILSNILQEIKNKEEEKFLPETNCPLCGAKYSEDSIKVAEQKFLDNKKNYIEKSQNNYNELNNRLIELNKLYNDSLCEKNKIVSTIASHKPKIDIEKLNASVKVLQEEKDKLSECKIDTSTYEKLCLQYKEIDEKLFYEKLFISTNNNIKELKNKLIDLTQQEADNERAKHLIDDYTLEVIEKVNQRVNNNNNKISFSMFDKRTADCDNPIKETCEVLMNGKTFDELSTGQKFYANFLTVIYLQKAYNVNLPIFFDESQSATFDKKCEQQLIEIRTQYGDTNIKAERFFEE